MSGVDNHKSHTMRCGCSCFHFQSFRRAPDKEGWITKEYKERRDTRKENRMPNVGSHDKSDEVLTWEKSKGWALPWLRSPVRNGWALEGCRTFTQVDSKKEAKKQRAGRESKCQRKVTILKLALG